MGVDLRAVRDPAGGDAERTAGPVEIGIARRAPQVAGTDAGRPSSVPAAGGSPQTVPTSAPAMSSLGLHPGAAPAAAAAIYTNN